MRQGRGLDGYAWASRIAESNGNSYLWRTAKPLECNLRFLTFGSSRNNMPRPTNSYYVSTSLCCYKALFQRLSFVCGLIYIRYHEQTSWQAYSLNTPEDEVFNIKIPKHATYDVVVEKLKNGLFENGLIENGVSRDVKILQVLCTEVQIVSEVALTLAKDCVHAKSASESAITRGLMGLCLYIVISR